MSENIQIQSQAPLRELPEPTLRRLPWYLAYVGLLKERGVDYVSSTQISKEINVDASMIAKDLSFLNIKGKTRIGYEVAVLEHELQDFLGFKTRTQRRDDRRRQPRGFAHTGFRLVNYGLRIVAGFDINPDVVDTDICGSTHLRHEPLRTAYPVAEG